MTPNEIYELPSIATEKWSHDYADIVRDVFKFNEDTNNYAVAESDSTRILIHTKLHYTSGGTRNVRVYAITFDDKPLAVMFSGGHGGDDDREHYVTNTQLWKDARGFMLLAMNSNADKDLPTAEGDVELMSKFHGATFVKTEAGYRAVNNAHTHPTTGNMIYDQRNFTRAWQQVKKDGLTRDRNDPRAETPETKAAILDAYQMGVVGKAVLLDTKLSDTQHLFAVNVIDDVTFAQVFDPRSKYEAWGMNITPFAIGPGNLLECYAEIAAGRVLDKDFSYIREVSRTFDVNPDTVVEMTTRFITDGGDNVAMQIMKQKPRDQRVPEVLDADYITFAMAFEVIDNPDITRVCPTATQKWATAIVDRAETLAAIARLPRA